MSKKNAGNLLITGATGLSGMAIIREFAKQNLPVKILIRNKEKAAMFKDYPLVEIFEGNMLKAESLLNAFQNTHRVLMISSARERMVETQCTFIDAAQKAGVPHIVKYSGAESGITFNSQAFSGTRNHEEVEDYLESSGIAWTHLRPSQFMQMYLREAHTITSHDSIFLPMETAKLSPVDVEDVAKAAVAIMTTDGHEGKSYDMTGPEALSMQEIAGIISSVTGRTISYINISNEQYRNTLIELGTPLEVVEILDEIFRERKKSPDSRVYLETHKIFGLTPTTFLEFVIKNKKIFLGQNF